MRTQRMGMQKTGARPSIPSAWTNGRNGVDIGRAPDGSLMRASGLDDEYGPACACNPGEEEDARLRAGDKVSSEEGPFPRTRSSLCSSSENTPVSMRHVPEEATVDWSTIRNLPASLLLHHVRYEIGEHPLADIVTLCGGGSSDASVTVGKLVIGGKAEQAGVATGDELVAVSGLPDFQRIPADRLLESLPTPSLLVFAKDLSASVTDEATASTTATETPKLFHAQSRRGGSIGDAAPRSRTESEAEASDRRVLSRDRGAQSEHPLAWIDDATKQKAGLDGGSGGDSVGGASQFASRASTPEDVGEEPSLKREKTMDDVLWEKANAAAQAAEKEAICREKLQRKKDLPRYNEGARQNPPVAPEHQSAPPKSTQLAIISRDDSVAGIPSGLSVFGPNVQVDLCDQVVFDPRAGLWMQSVQQFDDTTVSSGSTAPPAASGSVAWERVDLREGASEKQEQATWMYELPRQEARQLVEVARRAASRRRMVMERHQSRPSMEFCLDAVVTGEVDLERRWREVAAMCKNKGATRPTASRGKGSAKRCVSRLSDEPTPSAPVPLGEPADAAEEAPASFCDAWSEPDGHELEAGGNKPRPRLGPCGPRAVLPPMVHPHNGSQAPEDEK